MFFFDRPQKASLFDYYAPHDGKFIGLISVPHSGENIPSEFNQFLSDDPKSHREDLDFKVNELIDIPLLQKAGIAVMVAHIHRVCVDLNRSEKNCVLFWKKNTHGKPLVIKSPSAAEVERFIETYHRPYYEVLKSALQELEKRKKGRVSMIDLHSMPSRTTDYHMDINPNQRTHRPDFCISDRHGVTCEPDFIKYFHHVLSEQGHECTFNDPYEGGFITEYVNQFRTNNIQIEVKRGIYMDEVNKVLLPEKVTKLRPMLTNVFIEGFTKFDT